MELKNAKDRMVSFASLTLAKPTYHFFARKHYGKQAGKIVWIGRI